VPYQRGAIILINDEVVGVEIAPNALAFSAQWESLIRDCYGSEAITLQKEFKTIDESALLGEANTLEDLAEKVQKLEDREFEFAEKHVRDVLGQDEKLTQRQKEGELTVVDVETDDYMGQAVRRDDLLIDLTLLRRDAAQRGFRFRK
jgi:hypothetical protein